METCLRKLRGRQLGLPFPGQTGQWNAITDVPGVKVGYTTIIEGDGPLRVGEGPIRTGVTAILPRGHLAEIRPVWAGIHALNGNGEMTGSHWIRHAGHFSGPICLTNTHGIGVAHSAATKWMIRQYAEEFLNDHLWAMPVVAETYDGVLNDINGMHVREEHVISALEGAVSGPLAEGNVGGGTGMIAYEFKGGTGTASQVVRLGGRDYTVGVLVQANYGRRDWLTVLGVPAGQHMRENLLLDHEQGSIIVVIATDIPLLPNQLERLAQRGGLGISRSGSPGGNNSGDIFIAFSTANAIPRNALATAPRSMTAIPDDWLDPVYLATVNAVDEAVINAMLTAEDMTCVKPRKSALCKAIDPASLIELVRNGVRTAVRD
ncbi:L-aminopeptidase DmpA [Paracoccus pantotrophus]|uniref:L-aminopeptidase DmpA n=1 Tax=Paracoccus pantotrophus TaxID=82367 RepID=A0AAE6NX98_PARPN|nr:P1 family peptidase [Paracoccus pantotrophus]QFG36607.1 P1 family peptidase [Paracoccus pantotrophus]RKS43178.1 L-aminopeptidase DmpA [Paracoccus pantotrophus]RNI15107.1 S58 family peptidase [Paracoccus pantotrophus]